MAGDSGILLNNQMDDFSAKPGVPNVYGLVGGDANAVEPKKRPLSSMSPTIVVKDGKTSLVTGQPGRQSDHHHRTADGGQYHRFRDERRGSHQRAAFPPSMAAG
ncbi:gamma-glutamyltransferase [Klebsiella pneumoniae]|nr:gamma-glutamyltransferase [Klebsiella pneumoniae]